MPVRNVRRSLLALKIALLSVLSIGVIYLYYTFGPHHILPDGLIGLADRAKAPEERVVNLVMVFNEVTRNPPLQRKFRSCLRSLLEQSSIEVHLRLVGDPESHKIAHRILEQLRKDGLSVEQVQYLDGRTIAKQVNDRLGPSSMDLFRYKSTSYYGASLFFLSVVLHDVLSSSLKKVIMLDADLQFRSDIRELNSYFGQFISSQLYGLAPELTPVYRHMFSKYRAETPDTRIGAPPPHGLPGFNSGVLLLNLEKIRASEAFKHLISYESLQALTKKYSLQGHLGDQDLYTLISMDHPEYFFTLPCSWNRQLCQWWNYHGYADVFDQYFNCAGKPNVYHGNCNTAIPIE